MNNGGEFCAISESVSSSLAVVTSFAYRFLRRGYSLACQHWTFFRVKTRPHLTFPSSFSKCRHLQAIASACISTTTCVVAVAVQPHVVLDTLQSCRPLPQPAAAAASTLTASNTGGTRPKVLGAFELRGRGKIHRREGEERERERERRES